MNEKIELKVMLIKDTEGYSWNCPYCGGQNHTEKPGAVVQCTWCMRKARIFIKEMISLTYGELPAREDILKGIDGDTYLITRIENMPEIICAVNKGIDSHLEAIFFNQNGSDIEIEKNSMPVLIRRLIEIGTDGALETASVILYFFN